MPICWVRTGVFYSTIRKSLFTQRAVHAACSYETCPQTGQLSWPSRSVATSSGGQQRGHRLNPSSPPSVALAMRRSFSTSQRNFPRPAGASPVAESISRVTRTFSETTVIERSAECRASMSGGWQSVSLQRRDWLLRRVTRARFTAAG